MRTFALDVEIIENPILHVFGLLPDLPGADDFEFPVTTGTNGPLQRNVWPENPDMYWDPEGEDYFTVLGFYPTWMERRGTQPGISLWQFNTTTYKREASQVTLESNGWEVVDDDLHILHYSGSEDDRNALAGELNVFGSWMRDGEWDWIALPDDATFIVGTDEDRIRIVADHVIHNTAMAAVSERLRPLRHILRSDSYLLSVLPPQRVPVESSQASFISRCWTGDVPIIHSIGLQLESGDQVQPIIDSVQERLRTESSTLVGSPYADFLEIIDIAIYEETVRFDLVDSSEKWDIFNALINSDLLMLPPPTSEE